MGDSAASRSRSPAKVRGTWEEVAEAEVEEDEYDKDLPTDSKIRARLWRRAFIVEREESLAGIWMAPNLFGQLKDGRS